MKTGDVEQSPGLILMGVAGRVGQTYFNELVLNLTSALESQFTYVGERVGPEFDRIQTIAVCSHGQTVENFEYKLKDAPCRDVIGLQSCVLPSNVSLSYPQLKIMESKSIQGYIGVPIFDSGRQPLGILVTLYEQPIVEPDSARLILELFARQISNEVHRVAMEAELEVEKERFQSLLRGVPDMIFQIDRTGVIRDYVAPDGSDLAVPNSHVIGLNIRDIDFGPGKSEAMLEALDTCMRTDSIQTVEYELPLPKGRQYFEGRFVRVNKDHVSIVVRNITEQRKLEREKDRLQARLQHAEKIQSIGQLAGGIAHDFNNQLTGIAGYAEMIRFETGGNEALADYIDQILTATKRASDLTSQLLAFARKGKLASIEIDLHTLVKEVAGLLTRSIDKRIRIETQFEAEPHHVKGDPTQLQNVLLNLGLNARDAMPNGGQLTFRTSLIERDQIDSIHGTAELVPGQFVAVEVTDTGMGIDGQILDRIFEPFFTTKPEGQGTGMGLAAAYGTIRNHRGAIAVRSEPGGTTFALYLPAHQPSAVAAPVVDMEPRALPASRRCRVMVVDDESIIGTMLERMIQRMGHDAVTFTNGFNALDYFKEHWTSIDLVILDMMMPEIIGTDLFKRLRKVNPRVKAILSSGHMHQEAVEKTSMDGIIAFIPKPYRILDFQRMLEAALQEQG